MRTPAFKSAVFYDQAGRQVHMTSGLRCVRGVFLIRYPRLVWYGGKLFADSGLWEDGGFRVYGEVHEHIAQGGE